MNKNIEDSKKAILLWREKEFTNENLNQITKYDYDCIFKNFVLFSILRKNRDHEFHKSVSRNKNSLREISEAI